MIDKLPLLSCICVTRMKPALLDRAIECFKAQSYQQKELIIVYEDDDLQTIMHVSAPKIHADENGIRCISVPAKPKSSLGELRNIGIRAAKGEYISQWDDDDWYHADRLVEQYNNIAKSGCASTVLTRWLVFNVLDTKAYVSNKRLWEGSILCRRDIMLLAPYEDKHIGEDTATIDYLASHDCLFPMDNALGLYIYVYHGKNTWHYEHWQYIFDCGTPLPHEDSVVIGKILDGEYSVTDGSLIINRILEKDYEKERDSGKVVIDCLSS